MIVAVAMVKDEADIIGPVLAHLQAEGVDHAIVSDNLSSDTTPAVVEGFGDWVTLTYDFEVGYYQSVKMTGLARRAYEMGADWVLPFDADEVFYNPDGTSIAKTLADLDADAVLCQAWDHIPTYRDDPAVADPTWRMQHRRDHPQRLMKAVFRAHPGAALHQGNHDVEVPGVKVVGPLQLRHFQWRTLEQMIRKARNGKAVMDASTLDATYATHWRHYGSLTDGELAAEWDALCTSTNLVYDPAPVR